MAKRTRVKVKQASVTRAEAVAEFGRKKAKQRRQLWRRRVMIGGGVTAAACTVMAGGWMLATGKLQTSVARMGDGLWQSTASLGFRVDQVTLTGRNHARLPQVQTALGVSQGMPILSLSLAEMQARLLAVPEVKSVQITRVLPNQLAVAITERKPAAWWQVKGVQQLIDAEGVVLSRRNYQGKLNLPVVVGEDAEKHVGELLELLNTTPSLKPDVVAAVRVGQRRWNMQLAHDVVVMLPEEKPVAAWKRFATLVEKEALLGKAIRSVDMRVEDRVFIMPLEQPQNPITLTSARDT